MDPRYKPRPRCRHCRRVVTVPPSGGYCGKCRRAHRCRNCNAFKPGQVIGLYCVDCRSRYALDGSYRHARECEANYPADFHEARIRKYAARAARGEPIFDKDRNPFLDD